MTTYEIVAFSLRHEVTIDISYHGIPTEQCDMEYFHVMYPVAPW